MTVIEFSTILLGVAVSAGLLGALTGLGGGVVITPVLVLLFHIDIHYAMGASLVAVMATSTGTAIAFLREGYTNLRIGMFLETGAVIGALVGALLVTVLPSNIIAIIFGLVLLLSAYLTIRRQDEMDNNRASHPWAKYLKLEGNYPTSRGYEDYTVQKVPTALGIMTIAGVLSGLLGIGSGALKVLAMDHAMRLPYKVATATSNFMIGITAATSAGVYFSQGYINPTLTLPIVLGVLIGAVLGARILGKIKNKWLRIIFSTIVCFMALQMIYKAIHSGL